MLTSALDSFYSEIADVTEDANLNSPINLQVSPSISEDKETHPPLIMEQIKKKKKKVIIIVKITVFFQLFLIQKLKLNLKENLS